MSTQIANPLLPLSLALAFRCVFLATSVLLGDVHQMTDGMSGNGAVIFSTSTPKADICLGSTA